MLGHRRRRTVQVYSYTDHTNRSYDLKHFETKFFSVDKLLRNKKDTSINSVFRYTAIHFV